MDKKILNFASVKEKLQDRNGSEVSRRTGVSIGTIIRIKSGQIHTVNTVTLEKLSDYFEEKYKIINGEKK